MALRAGTKFGERKAQVTSEQQQQAVTTSIISAVTAWDRAKQSSDPAFKQGTPLYENMMAFFTLFKHQEPYADSAGAIRTLEKAYTKAKALVAGPPPKPTPKTLRSSRSTSTSTAEPKTMREAAAMAAKKHGYSLES